MIFRTVGEIKHDHVVSSSNFMNEILDEHPQEHMKQPLKNFGVATELYMVEVIARSHFGSSH